MVALFKSSLCVFLMICTSGLCTGQETVLYQDANQAYENLVKEFDQGLYGRCVRSAEKFLTTWHDPAYTTMSQEAEILLLTSKLRMDTPGIIGEILAFADRNQPGAVAQRAIVLVGDEAYAAKRYDDAIRYFSLVDPRVLPAEEQSALHFKMGYCLFVRKEFDPAAAQFDQTRKNRDKYYYPSNYYYGMTQYFNGNNAEAIRSFELVAPSDYYKDYIPYYITQIYFTEKDYNKVIGYGNQSLRNNTVQSKTEIHHLVGQACFETGDYSGAIDHLEYVEKQSTKWRMDDFYQLGMAYYHEGRYAEAISPLSQIRNETGEKAQYANYFLGRCYLETGDRISARNSLMKAAKMEDVPSVALEATYHYGRLSAEAGDDLEAIRALKTIPVTASVYNDAQKTLADILTNTTDYTLAIREIESIQSLSPVMKEAYQKVCLFRGEQLLQEGKPVEAALLMEKSLKYPQDKTIEARGCFWMGEMAHQDGYYYKSIEWYNRYFKIATTAKDLPPYQDLPVAKYNQGYNYIRQSDYAEAQKWFEPAVESMKLMPVGAGSFAFIRQQVYPDAVLRAGDCAFKKGQYDKANGYYSEAIRNTYPGSDYAEYQNALIKGLQNKPSEKIALLEKLVKEDPGSLWADDALFQIGVTYQDQNQVPDAMKSYERIVNHYSKSVLLQPALLRLGLLSYNSGQYEKALGYYKSIFNNAPDPETSREAMAAIQEIYVNELDKPDAYFAFATSIPGYAVSETAKDSILYTAAENHYAQGEYAGAIESFKRYIDGNPNGLYTLKATYLRAECLTLLKRYPEALDGYEAVIKKGQSSYLPAACHKAALIAYNEKEDFDRAYNYYSMFIPLAPDEELQYEAILGALRSAYRTDKQTEVLAMSQLLFDHPRATEDHKSQAHYYLAKIAYDHNSMDKALEEFNAVIHANSAELAAESRYYIAAIYAKGGADEIAAKLAEEAARANVGYPFWVAKSLILLADIQYKSDDLLNAHAILDAIRDNYSGDEAIMKEVSDMLQKVEAAEQKQNRIKPDNSDTLELQTNTRKED